MRYRISNLTGQAIVVGSGLRIGPHQTIVTSQPVPVGQLINLAKLDVLEYEEVPDVPDLSLTDDDGLPLYTDSGVQLTQ